jgi:hypothetical protein
MIFTTTEFSPKKGPLLEARYSLRCSGRNNKPHIMVEQAIFELLHFKEGIFLQLLFRDTRICVNSVTTGRQWPGKRYTDKKGEGAIITKI